MHGILVIENLPAGGVRVGRQRGQRSWSRVQKSGQPFTRGPPDKAPGRNQTDQARAGQECASPASSLFSFFHDSPLPSEGLQLSAVSFQQTAIGWKFAEG
jgi:hypothetical protein